MARLTGLEGGKSGSKGGRPSGKAIEDLWGLDAGHQYDPDQFYTRSTNKHDHSFRLELRIPPYVQGLMAEAVDHIPLYRSMADMARDAIVHRLHILGPEWLTPNSIAQLDLEMRLTRIEQRKVRLDFMAEMLNGHRDVLERAYEAKDAEELSNALADTEDDIEALGEPYKGKLQELAKEYRARLKGMG